VKKTYNRGRLDALALTSCISSSSSLFSGALRLRLLDFDVSKVDLRFPILTGSGEELNEVSEDPRA
jgi:hypothetical protein